MISNAGGRGFLARVVIGAIVGQSPEDFAEQELRRMRCKWCADGWPVVDGQHDILGVIIPCDAVTRAVGQEEAE